MEALSSTEIFLFEGFQLDQRGLFRRHENAALAPVEIGSRALDVLGVLLRRPGGLLSRDEIMAAAWPGMVVEANNLNVQISGIMEQPPPNRNITVLLEYHRKGVD